MKVREIMTPNVEVVSPGATLQEVACKMRDLDVGPIPVCDGERIQGMVTDRDITIRATAEGLDPKTTTVERVMTAGVHWCYEDDDIEQAEKVMQDNQVRRILVMDRDKKLCGILSLGDLAVDAGNAGTERTLQEISEPAHPNKQAA